MDPNAFLPSNDIKFVVKNNSSMHRSIKVFNTLIGPGNTLDLMKVPGITEEDIRSELTKSYFKALFAGRSLIIISSTVDFTTSDSNHSAFLASIGLPGFLDTAAPAPTLTQILYVNKSGNDATASGNDENPFLTIATAMANITDNSINKRYLIDVGPGEYSGSWGIKPWVGIKGANGGSNGATPNGGMLTEITAPINTVGFDSSWTSSAGFGIAFMSFLGFTNHQTWDESVSPGMEPQINFENCSFNSGASFLAPGNLGFDNVSMQHCISYGGFTVTGWQFLWLKGCTLLGGTVTVNAGGASATTNTTLLAQNTSIGADYANTNIVVHWASPSSNSVYAEVDLSNSTTVGNLTMDGVNTTYDCFIGSAAGTISLLNGATNFQGTILGCHAETHGPIPGVSPGIAAGAGASSPIDVGSDDQSGLITLNTGTGAGTGAMLNVTYGIPWNGEHPPHVIFSRADANITGQFYISSMTRNGFIISASAAPTSSATYVFTYIVFA
jgi:hypothetical protein